jgi:hypothetical protein
MSTRVITPPARASYVQVHEPKPGPDGGAEKYNISLIFPKDSTDLSKLEAAIKEAAEAKFGKKVPKNLRTPIRDGDIDREDRPEYADSWFMNASSTRKPGLVDADRDPILEADEFYSGCICRAEVRFFGYDQAGNKGVGCGLNNIQKLKDGERLDGTVSAEAAFEDADDVDLDNL